MTNQPTALHANPPKPAEPAIPSSGHDRIIRKKELALMLGISEATIYRWIKTENFPKAIKLGANSVGWWQSEIDQWLNSREKA
ncbi:hypothetical protein AVO42_11045 [Thiomicrospira sp. XS5]|uniref:helix-turn-helix transcriptional regulator n=1 Tax=Thiomicrospira sp. XS5 TaxID=1775636 RepID=UPI0007495113|nr:AlpA family transcriptional regulator [Thiomicrospira sp. XS5]KUJ75808.1 hypothetical protein AVO42_11045 [Thiomicrospira sp. XS5]